MWRLECKGFHINDETFTVIVPIWSDYSKQYCLYPVNHAKITGEVVNHRNYDHSLDKEWHSDNPFSKKKWIEVNINLCNWEWNERKEYVIKSITNLSYPTEFEGNLYKTHRFLYQQNN